MKLIIQIPCYNEEKTLPVTIGELPRQIDRVDEIEILVVDDGSTDNTARIAEESGAHHILSFTKNKGLARAFNEGIEFALGLGADIIVNTDADNQYFGPDTEKLINPILDGNADVVIGDRETRKIRHFSWFKKILQKLGSRLVKNLSNTEIQDAVSGFRAYSREAAMHLNILTGFSYTIESIIQLGHKKINIISIPVRTNEKLRDSRLFKNIFNFLYNQLSTIIRVYSTYKGLKVFSFISLILFIPGIAGLSRFLYHYISTGGGGGHIQSLIFSAIFLLASLLIFLFGIIADLIGYNRLLIEKVLYKIKKLEYDSDKKEL